MSPECRATSDRVKRRRLSSAVWSLSVITLLEYCSTRIRLSNAMPQPPVYCLACCAAGFQTPFLLQTSQKYSIQCSGTSRDGITSRDERDFSSPVPFDSYNLIIYLFAILFGWYIPTLVCIGQHVEQQWTQNLQIFDSAHLTATSNDWSRMPQESKINHNILAFINSYT